MNELDHLLEIIDVPPTDAAADVARGERGLRRRRRTQVGAVAASVAAVTAVGFALHGASGSPDAAGFAGQAGSSSPNGVPSTPAAPHQLQHGRKLSAIERRLNRLMDSGGHQALLRDYHDVLAEHLDPTGDHLRLAQNEQGGSGVIGTKLDWNGGGMLEIVLGKSWGAAGGLLPPRGRPHDPDDVRGSAGPGEYPGRRPGRLGRAPGRDRGDPDRKHVVRQQRHVHRRASASAEHQLLAAAADPRLTLPSYLR